MDITQALQSIGFSEYEAKAYLALLESYPATGYQISKISGVPRSMIYEVLNRLQSRGFVLLSNDEKNVLYRPLPPTDLLENFQSKLDHTLSFLSPQLEKIYLEDDDTRIWTLHDLDAVITYSKSMLNKATREVYLMVNDDHQRLLQDGLDTLAEKRLDTNFLITGNTFPDFGEVSHHPPLESERQGLNDVLLVLVDDHEVLIANTGITPNATITTNSNLILIARQFIWMEFFTQRILSQIGEDLAATLDKPTREILENKLQITKWRNPE